MESKFSSSCHLLAAVPQKIGSVLDVQNISIQLLCILGTIMKVSGTSEG